MRGAHLFGDLSLLDQGLRLGWEFGLASVEELARVGQFISQSVYEPHSLRATPNGAEFWLRNPPLRMGAFSALRLLWDGTPLSGAACILQPTGTPVATSFAAVDRDHPVPLPVGVRVRYAMDLPTAPPGGPHTVRLELTSLAIRPTVWLEFTDTLSVEGEPR